MEKRIKVILTDDEAEFLENALKDNLYGECKNINELMARMFYLQLREDMEYIAELKD